MVVLCVFQYLKLWHFTVSWSKAQWCSKRAVGMLVGRRKVTIGACFSRDLERCYPYVMILSLQHGGDCISNSLQRSAWNGGGGELKP